MPSLLRKIRRPLIALMAICVTSFATSEAGASACSAISQDMNACATACGCCTSGESTAPAAGPQAASYTAASQAPQVGCPASSETCSCRAERPTAPEPKSVRSPVERRSEPSNSSAFVVLDDTFVVQSTRSPQVPATQSPPKAPLYLKNARLLF